MISLSFSLIYSEFESNHEFIDNNYGNIEYFKNSKRLKKLFLFDDNFTDKHFKNIDKYLIGLKSFKLKREWSDHLLEDLKNIFSASKSGQVMNKTAYKKCITPVGHKLWKIKHSIFNRDS